MKIRDKLLNPFILVGQGFLAGALIFFGSFHRSDGEGAIVSPDQDLRIEAPTSTR